MTTALRHAAALAISLTVGLGAVAASAEDKPGFIRVTPSEIRWIPIPGGLGAKFAVLLGDPNKPAPYVIRVMFPPHVMDTPHSHPNDRYVTVLSGTWYAGTGPTFDPATATPLPAGSVMFHPGGAAHWDGSAGDDGAVVQITGMGPGPSIPVDPKASPWVSAPTPKR